MIIFSVTVPNWFSSSCYEENIPVLKCAKFLKVSIQNSFQLDTYNFMLNEPANSFAQHSDVP